MLRYPAYVAKGFRFVRRPTQWRSPLASILSKLRPAALHLSLLAGLLLGQTACSPDAAPRAIPPPWQTGSDSAQHLDVFSIRLGRDSLGTIQSQWRKNLEIALFEDPDGGLTLEAYVHRFDAGGIVGQLVLHIDPPEEWLLEAAHHATDRSATASGNHRLTLSQTDLDAVWAMQPVALSFIAKHSDITAGALRARFGKPAQIKKRIVTDQQAGKNHGKVMQLEYWMYPKRGILLELDFSGSKVFHYLPPQGYKEFQDRLTQG